jgi:hypothetical protein
MMQKDTRGAADKKSWKHSPIETPKKISINLTFSATQYRKIKKGLIPICARWDWELIFDAADGIA